MIRPKGEAVSNVARFEKLLRSDEAIQARMRELVDAYRPFEHEDKPRIFRYREECGDRSTEEGRSEREGRRIA